MTRQMRIARAVADEIDSEMILGQVAKRGRAVVPARTPTIERDHDWTGTCVSVLRRQKPFLPRYG